jgi:hypothetical protein
MVDVEGAKRHFTAASEKTPAAHPSKYFFDIV